MAHPSTKNNGRTNGKAAPPPPAMPHLIVNTDEAEINELPPFAFVEWEEQSRQQIAGRMIIKRKPIKRMVTLYDYVPSEVYDLCMLRYDQFQEIFQQASSEEERGAADPFANLNEEQRETFSSLMWEMVLRVWQCTEEDMELERLKKGLQFEHLMGLFAHFFSQARPQ